MERERVDAEMLDVPKNVPPASYHIRQLADHHASAAVGCTFDAAPRGPRAARHACPQCAWLHADVIIVESIGLIVGRRRRCGPISQPADGGYENPG